MNRFCALLLGFLVSASAQAGILFTANLTHSQETTRGDFLTSTGDPRPQSFGTASFFLNDAMTALSFIATIDNIDITGTQTVDPFDNLTAAHIHAPAPPGSNGGVVWGFFGAPDNDNTPDSIVVTPYVSGVGGIITSVWDLPEGNGGTNLALQLPNILAGLSYINFHTVQFRGGEIRGQILRVPEPSTLALIATAASLLLICTVRRRVRIRP